MKHKMRAGQRWKNQSPSYPDVIIAGITEINRGGGYRQTKIHFCYVGDHRRGGQPWAGTMKPRDFRRVFEPRWAYHAELWYHRIARTVGGVCLFLLLMGIWMDINLIDWRGWLNE